ncbi:MAG: ABC transporter ATP-binding protein [Candidatus Dormibacteraceae bacterium]
MLQLSARADPAITLTRVARAFQSGGDEVVALADVSLTIAIGETTAITGPSGSGKTTLLNLVAGLDRPTSGTVIVLGQDLTSLKERELTAFRARSLGLVFQDPHLLPGLTALENVIAARLPWTKRRVLEPEARKLLKVVGLGSRMNHPPARLSGGERQRVGIARALLGQPRLLLADEPTGNLDIGSTEELLNLFEELRSDLGLTVVVATHDPAVAAIAHRVIRLSGGRIVEDRLQPSAERIEVRELE